MDIKRQSFYCCIYTRSIQNFYGLRKRAGDKDLREVQVIKKMELSSKKKKFKITGPTLRVP